MLKIKTEFYNIIRILAIMLIYCNSISSQINVNNISEINFDGIGDEIKAPLGDLIIKNGNYSYQYIPTIKLKTISNRINEFLNRYPLAVISLKFQLGNGLNSNELIFDEFTQEIYFLREFLMTYNKDDEDHDRIINLHPSVMSYINLNNITSEYSETYLVASITALTYFITDENNIIIDVSDFVKQHRIKYEIGNDILVEDSLLPRVTISNIERNGNGDNLYIIECSQGDGYYSAIKLNCDFIISIDVKYDHDNELYFLDVYYSDWCMSTGNARIDLSG